MPRRQTNLRGPKDNSSQKSKQKRKIGRSLDALAIAERQYPTKPKIRQSRLGDDDEFSKRKRGSGRDRDDSDGPDSKRRRTDDMSSDSSNAGSDGEGHQWRLGEVDSDNDSELDSDEAMGSSDEERFEGFTFRGSSTFKSKPKQKAKQKRGIDLSEDVEESDGDDWDEEEDDLGEDAVDLATAWDMNTAAEEAEKESAKKKTPTAGTFSDGSDESDAESEEEYSDESSDDESGLSLSDDEADAADERGLSKLQSFVNSMETDAANKPKQKTSMGQEQGKPTEYGLTSTRKLTIADLLPSITDSRLRNSLKHVDSTVSSQKPQSGIPGKLDAPLPKRQQDRLDRAVAYEKSKETLDRWIETVKANRRAEHLSFPLVDPDAQQNHRMGIVQPQTNLESTIQNILVESGLVQADGKSAEDQVQEFEELQARKMPLEEIRARRAELRKHRDLLFREEVRAKRIKKIKSKSYRRVHRKERERLEQQERQALMEAGVDLDEEDRERNERRRAEARMASKHKESKWAKSLKQTGRTAWDEDARQGAADLAQREEELRKRIEGKHVSRADDDYLDSSSSESEDEDPWQEDGSDAEKRKLGQKLSALEADGEAAEDVKGPHSKLLSMKFMQNADAARKEQNDAEIRRLHRELNGDESQSEAESEVGRRKFGRSEAEKPASKSKPLPKNEFEEAPGSDDEEARANESDQDIKTVLDRPDKRKSGLSAAKGTARSTSGLLSRNEPDAEEENPWLVQTNRNNRRRTADNSQEDVDITLNDSNPRVDHPKPKAKQPAPKQLQVDHDSDSDDDSKVPVLLKNHDLVKRAFAGDEVVQDFEQEKLDTIEEEGDKVIDNTLPGWGSWTGEGVSKKQQKRQKRFLTTVEGVKPENRKDAKLSRVIINEKRIQKVKTPLHLYSLTSRSLTDLLSSLQNKKYLATQLPHPFESRQQYERSLRLPIGPEWSTKETFQNATKPRVMVKQGIIKPMEKPMV